MTIEELSENMRFTDNEVIFDKQFYNDVMLKCFINSSSYKKLCQELKNETKKYKDVIDKAIDFINSNPLVIIGDYDYFVNDLLQMEEDCKEMSFIRTLLKILEGEINE